MIAFVVTDFEGHWPVGTCAVAWARDREECKRVVHSQLRAQGLGRDNPDGWTIEPITPLPEQAGARVILNGDY